MTEGGSLLKINSSSRRLTSSGRKEVPTEAKTASRVLEVMDPSGVVAPGSYSALDLLACHDSRNQTDELTLIPSWT